MDVMEKPLQELVSLEPATAKASFEHDDTSMLEPVLAIVRQHVEEFLPKRDLSTVAGRKEIASFAYKVAQSKTALEKIGKQVADDAKALPKKIDANRRYITETLEKWRDEVRKPLDDWEEAEKARLDRHASAIEGIRKAAQLPHGVTSQEVAERLQDVERTPIDTETCEEFLDDYRAAVDAAIPALRTALETTRRAEAQAAELEALRREKEERDALERERLAAEAAAQKARDEERQRAAEEIAARERAAQAELEAANRRALEAERQAEETRRRAEEEERRRQEVEARQKAEDEANAADREHVAAINREALEALVKAGVPQEHAKTALVAIIKGQVPRVSIRY
jgi:hypothetical protein